MIAYALYMLYLSYVWVEKLADGDLNELFVPLLRDAAAVTGGEEEAVSIPEMIHYCYSNHYCE